MVRGIFGAPKARILPLKRRSKKRSVVYVEQLITSGMTARRGKSEIFPAAIRMYIWNWKFDESNVRLVAK